MLYFLLLKPGTTKETTVTTMNLTSIFPTFTAIYKSLTKRSKPSKRSLAERIEELENMLNQFLPWDMATRICARFFRHEPNFDLQSPEEEDTRYWIGRAIADFQFKVREFCYQFGTAITDELLENIKKGTQIYCPNFLPTYLPRFAN